MRRLLQVMGDAGCSGALRRECSRGASVRAECPCVTGQLADGAAHDRVAKPKAADGFTGADQILPEQLVERLDCIPLGDICGHPHKLGLKRIAQDRCRLNHGPRERRKGIEFPTDRCPHGRRNAGLNQVLLGRQNLGATVRGADELLEIEGIAAALSVKRTALRRLDAIPQELLGFRRGQRSQFDSPASAMALGLLQCGQEAGIALRRP
jgi:hypothetical protein